MSSSAQHRLGLARCPECGGTGKVPLGVVANAVDCIECGGGGRVTLARHHELIGLKSIHLTPVPDTEPDPEQKS